MAAAANSRTIGITGANGQLGRLVVERLKAKLPAASLIALVRTPAKAADLGIEARPFDFASPQQDLVASLKGIHTLFFISSLAVDDAKQQEQNVVDAAKAAGVQRVVYTSLISAPKWAKTNFGFFYETEKALTAAAIPELTFLRNGWYIENQIVPVRLAPALAAGSFPGCANEGKISGATREDYADAAVVILLDHTKKHVGVLQIAGDRSYTLTEAFAEVSRQSGKQVSYNNVSAPALEALFAQYGAHFAKLFAQLDEGAAAGWLFDEAGLLSKIIGRATTTLQQRVARTLEEIKKQEQEKKA